MTITIPPELEQFVRQKIAAGQYVDESHVVTLALHYLKSSEELGDIEHLRREIALGLDEANRGLSAPWDPEEIKAEGRRLLAESQRDQQQAQR
jgi:putative addiction module CopG family antidote